MKALITGVAGQDGSYLAELLLAKDYEVHGMVRRYTIPHFPNIQHLLDDEAIHLHEGDLSDQRSLEHVIKTIRPDEVYNLGSMSHVGTSFNQPELTANVTGLGPMRVFEAVRRHAPNARVYQASSSEMFGNILTMRNLEAADETTRFSPVSPYAIAKVEAHQWAHVYRQAYGLHASCGILFNHESERRGENFVTRKITLGLARIKHGLQKTLELGNPRATRDWGYAPEYMEAAWRMLQKDAPDDYVVATGVGQRVMWFLQEAADVAGVDIMAEPRCVKFTDSERRPTDIDYLVGDASKARNELEWRPQTDAPALVRLMVRNDLAHVQEAASN